MPSWILRWYSDEAEIYPPALLYWSSAFAKFPFSSYAAPWKVNDMITQIATAAEEQSTTGEEVASNIESVASITNNTANDAELSSAYSDQLNSMASDLKAMAGEFKLRSIHKSGKTPKTIQPVNTIVSANDIR
jgi:hypothetical protein